MNETIESFIRQQLKQGLALCSKEQQALFKRMYSHNNPNLDIDKVVDTMSEDKLDHALTQVERTIMNNTKKQ